jgi:hypothetical protein
LNAAYGALFLIIPLWIWSYAKAHNSGYTVTPEINSSIGYGFYYGLIGMLALVIANRKNIVGHHFLSYVAIFLLTMGVADIIHLSLILVGEYTLKFKLIKLVLGFDRLLLGWIIIVEFGILAGLFIYALIEFGLGTIGVALSTTVGRIIIGAIIAIVFAIVWYGISDTSSDKENPKSATENSSLSGDYGAVIPKNSEDALESDKALIDEGHRLIAIIKDPATSDAVRKKARKKFFAIAHKLDHDGKAEPLIAALEADAADTEHASGNTEIADNGANIDKGDPLPDTKSHSKDREQTITTGDGTQISQGVKNGKHFQNITQPD